MVIIFFLILFFFQLHNIVNGKIISSFILPHGGIALDPNHFETNNQTKRDEAIQIHNILKNISKKIIQLKPDIIFLSTPHGLSDDKNFLFYQNKKGYGNAETEGNYKGYEIEISINSILSSNLLKYLKNSGEKVSGLTAFSQDETIPLRWGEIIPIYFIEKETSIEIIVMSHPTRRYNESVQMIPELLYLGEKLFYFLENLQQKVIIIVSGDLAHTHEQSGPYGYSPEAELFDKACGRWATTLDSNELIGNHNQSASHLVSKALSCGFTGFVLLQGILNGKLFESSLLINCHPSYYGMMIASFFPKIKNE